MKKRRAACQQKSERAAEASSRTNKSVAKTAGAI
jgi:hypothetical protein